MNRDELILSAYQLGMIGDHETLSAQQIAIGASKLNLLLQMLVTTELTYWTTTTYIIPAVSFTANKATITSATLGTSENPVKVHAARRINSTSTEIIDIPVVGRAKWMQWNTSISGITAPTEVYVQRGSTDLAVYVWPGIGTYSLEIDVQSQNVLPTIGTSVILVPEHWYLPLVYKLACELAPANGMSIEERNKLEQQRDKLTEKAEDFDAEGRSLFIQPRYDY